MRVYSCRRIQFNKTSLLYILIKKYDMLLVYMIDEWQFMNMSLSLVEHFLESLYVIYANLHKYG